MPPPLPMTTIKVTPVKPSKIPRNFTNVILFFKKRKATMVVSIGERPNISPPFEAEVLDKPIDKK